jgi:hypothetical protein
VRRLGVGRERIQRTLVKTVLADRSRKDARDVELYRITI